MRPPLFLLILSILHSCLLAGLSIQLIEESPGRLVFDVNIQDTLERDSAGEPRLISASLDAARLPFYPASFSLPPHASVKNIVLSANPSGIRCILGTTGMIRQCFVATFRIYPALPKDNQSTIQQSGRVTLSIAVPAAKTSASITPDNPYAEKALSNLLANYGTSAKYRQPAAVSLAKAISSPSQNARIKLLTNQAGIFSISFDQIQALGFSAGSIDPLYFHLYDHLKEIPIYIETSIKGRFSSGDRILFYGTFEPGIAGRYYPEQTISKAYYLDWNAQPGLRAPLVSGAPKYLSGSGEVLPFDPRAYSSEPRNIHEIKTFRRNVHLEKDLMIVRLSTPANTVSSEVNPEDFEFSMEDYWMWAELSGAVNENLVNFSLDAAPAKSGKARLRIRLLGYSRGQHTVTLFMNGVKLKPLPGPGADTTRHTLSWVGQTAATFETALTDSNLTLIKGGVNTLTVSHELYDGYFLNWIEAEYDAVPGLCDGISHSITLDTGNVSGLGSYLFSLSNTTSLPEVWDQAGRRFTDLTLVDNTLQFYDVIQTPTTYHIASQPLYPAAITVKPKTDIRATARGADLLIITPTSLRYIADKYAAFKQSRGLLTFTANVESIYDEFGDGSMDPEAIKSFVKYAYENLSPKPFYLLILGNGSEGGDKKSPWRNLVPTFFIQMNGWGLTAADSRFTTVSGEDLLPDLSVGRIPGKTAAEVEAVLDKIMAYETASDQGAWKNNALLIGGLEHTFTQTNDRWQETLLKGRVNVSRVDADTGSVFFFPQRNPAEVSSVFNRGALFVNFYGHGGGSVWSDGRPSIMDNPAAAALSNLKRLPVVFSMTCLTASFEAVFDESSNLWTPLGITMLLSPKGGCSAFYGASGHSFVTPDYQLGRLVLEHTTQSTKKNIGDIIFGAEENLIAALGTQYFPVICQYNLLGDPSMPLIAPETLSVSALNNTLGTEDTLKLAIQAGSLTSGSGVVRIYKDNGSLSFYKDFSFSNPRDTINVIFKPGQTFTSGEARIILWNNTRTLLGRTRFSINDISLSETLPYKLSDTSGDTIRLLKCALEDSVYLEARFFKPASVVIDTIYASWDADTTYRYLSGSDTLPNILPLQRMAPQDTTQPIRYSTISPISISSETFGSQRNLAYSIAATYRTADNARHLIRKFYNLTVQTPPDLSFPRTGKITLFVDGKLVARNRFVNYGESTSKPFILRQTINGTDLDFPYLSPLPQSHIDSLDAPVIGTGFIKIRSVLDAERTIAESDEGNNVATVCFGATGTTLGRLDSLLFAPYKGLSICAAKGDTIPVFLTMDEIDSLDNQGRPVFTHSTSFPFAPLQSACRPQDADSLSRYDLTALVNQSLPRPDSLLRVSFKPPVHAAKMANRLVSEPQFGFYIWEESLNFWKWYEPVSDTSDSSLSIILSPGKRFVPGLKLDQQGPLITASVNGRLLSYQDYIPLKTTIDVQIQDDCAVDTGTIRVFSSGWTPLPRDQYAMGYAGGIGNVSLSFRPGKEGADSLYILASDINGNPSDTVKLGYQLGSSLLVQSFANHPNPFGLRTTFAFTITDDADVEIRIFTLAGKMIKRFALRNVVGYHEVEWDSRDDQGRKISNGVYYLKLTVSNRERSLEHIYKIAKSEGR